MEMAVKVFKFSVFVVAGTVMFPAWILVLTLHEAWIGLID